MNLSRPKAQYDQGDEAQARSTLEKADRSNRKKDADVVIEPGRRLVGYSPDGTKFQLVFNDDGTLGTLAL